MPQVKRLAHWSQIIAELKVAGVKGIAVRDLAAEFDLDMTHPDFVKALDIVQKQGKLITTIGFTKNRETGLVVQLSTPFEPGRKKDAS